MSKLFEPIKVGEMQLKHRVVMAPMTRFRTSNGNVPIQPLVSEYYAQRASIPGTFLITEATSIAPCAGGYLLAPGIWSNEQISSWKKVSRAVHAQGSFIFLQLWAVGRAAYPDYLSTTCPTLPYVSASDIPLSDRQQDIRPRPLTISEIKDYVEYFSQAAENAVHKAGFDGVEIHAANGYLIDQFLQDVSNRRTDGYGGSVINRTRFALEIVEAITKRVGQTKTAIRFSPWGTFQDMGMEDPKPTFSYIISKLRDHYPNLAYVHLIEPRVDGSVTRKEGTIPEHWSNDFVHDIYGSGDGANQTRLISTGGYTRRLGMEVAETKRDLIAYGRLFLSNPDLPFRLKHNIPLNRGNRSTYGEVGKSEADGYTDYPFAPAHDPTSAYPKTAL